MYGLLILSCAIAAPGDLTLARGGTSPYTIVVAPDAPAADQTAARELQATLAEVTGVTLPLAAAPPAGQPAVVVGDGAAFRARCPEVNLAALGHDGIVIRTVGDDLVLAGRAPRGTLYAVYTFLEDTVGCRWWTATESTLPSRPELIIPAQQVEYAPALRTREPFYKGAFDGPFAAKLKANGHFARIPAEYGGHYKILGWCHTFYQLLPPEKYFDAHPEWYSEIDGQRVAERHQLCLTNDAMRAELTRVALEWIRQEPEAGIISISQNDWRGACQCANCRAVEEAEGGPSGPIIRFVNEVAADIEKEFPDFLVETLAYSYTRHAPKQVRPRDNVVVRLCSIECSFAEPLETGPQNAAFGDDLRAWSAISPNLYIWNYVTNFSNYLLPHPNLRNLATDIRSFVDHHTISLFEQGDSMSTVGDFVRLRAWLLAHLMWDPSRDENALLDEFLNGYYGAAGPILRQYLDLLEDSVKSTGAYLRCYHDDTAAWLPYGALTAAQDLLRQAAAAVAGDEVLAARVERESLPLRLVWLNRYDNLKRDARRAGEAFAGPADPAADWADWQAVAARYDNTFYGEGRPFGDFAQRLANRFRPPGPPPEQVKGLPEEDWIDGQDNRINYYGVGKWVTVVEDPTASDGWAARLTTDHTQWAVQWHFPGDVGEGDQRWRVYARVRCDATATDGVAMQVGLYDGAARKNVTVKPVPIADAAGTAYLTIDLGVHALTSEMYCWIAPVNNPDAVQAVWVDGLFLVRVK